MWRLQESLVLLLLTVTHVACYLMPLSLSANRGRNIRIPAPCIITLTRKSSSRCHQSHQEEEEEQRQQQQQQLTIDFNTVKQRQLREAQATLERIERFKSSLLQQHTEDEDRSGSDGLTVDDSDIILQQLQELEQQVDQITFTPPGLDRVSYMKSIAWYLRLPLTTKGAIGQALDLSDDVSRDWKQAPTIISQLYQLYQPSETTTTNKDLNRFTQRLQQAMKSYQKRREQRIIQQQLQEEDATRDKKITTALTILKRTLTGGYTEEDSRTLDELDEAEEDTAYYGLLGRVTRKEGKGPTTQDLQALLYLLDHGADGNDKNKKIFTVSGVQTIAEGFVLRGTNHKSNSTALLAAIDAKFKSPETSVSTPQVFFMPDYFSLKTEDYFTGKDPVLVLLNRDLSPSTPSYAMLLLTMTGLATTLLFGVGVYGANDLITQRLMDANALSDYQNGLDWFNGMMWIDLIAPLLVIQIAHDAGNWLVAWKEGFRMGFPTLVPFWLVPNMGAWTPIVTAPKNLTSVFDFAMLGSIMGLAASAAFLMAGLQATVEATPEVAQYFPALSVSFLKLSTLGGTLVDKVLGGGNGFILLQDPADLVPVHPYVICGLSGFMIQAIGLLPSGSNDGGRMAQAVFGRIWHTAVTTIVWLGMLSTSALFEQHDLFLGALIVNSFIQSDKEVPCRDETANVDIFRGIAALAMWTLAIFILTPIVSQ